MQFFDIHNTKLSAKKIETGNCNYQRKVIYLYHEFKAILDIKDIFTHYFKKALFGADSIINLLK